MSIKRGQIYYVGRSYAAGSEMRAGRPGIIVSNDRNNDHSSVVEVIYLTTHPKKDLPTHVTIRSMERESVALCEQVTSVSTDRLGRCMGEVTEAEMQSLEIAMLISLGIQMKPTTPKKTEDPVTELRQALHRAAVAGLRQALEAEKTKREALQWAHEALLDRLLKKEDSTC